MTSPSNGQSFTQILACQQCAANALGRLAVTRHAPLGRLRHDPHSHNHPHHNPGCFHWVVPRFEPDWVSADGRECLESAVTGILFFVGLFIVVGGLCAWGIITERRKK
jgi:hypothetical protein